MIRQNTNRKEADDTNLNSSISYYARAVNLFSNHLEKIMSQEKIDTLCKYEGITFDDFAEIMIDSVNPGICMNEDCEYTTDVEPDQTEGWCEVCSKGTVMALSELVMAGFLPTE